MFHFPDADKNLPLQKFESMLKTNDVYFFDSDEFEQIVAYYLDNGKVSLAKKALDLGLKQHPTLVSLKLAYAELLIFEEKFDEAYTLLDQLQDIEPSNDQIYLHKATVYSKKDMHKEAIVALHQALLFAEDEVDILAMIGMEYLRLDDYETARFNFAKCLEVEYDDYSSLYNIIYCFDMEQKHQEAIDYLTDYIDKDPYCEIAWHQLGIQYYTIEDYNNALRAFDYSILIDDAFLGAYIEKAKTLEQLNQFNNAIESYLCAISIDDGTPYIYLRLGYCYEKTDDNKTALKYYNLAVKEDPLLDKAWIALTNLYVKNKDFKKALFYINKALQINNENVLYWNSHAEINLKLNLFEDAVQSFQKCIKLEDYRLENFIRLTDTLHYIGEYYEALAVLHKAASFYNDFAEIEYRLSGIYFLLQKDEEGLKYLKNGLKIDYDYHNIIEKLYPSIFKKETVQALLNNYEG